MPILLIALVAAIAVVASIAGTLYLLHLLVRESPLAKLTHASRHFPASRQPTYQPILVRPWRSLVE